MLCQVNIKKKPRKARLAHILIFPYTCLSPAVLFHLVSVFAKTPDGLFNSFSFTPQLICSHSIHCQKTEIKSLNLVNIPNQSHQIRSMDMISVPVNSVWMLGVEFLQNLFPNSVSSRPPNTSENGGLRGRQHETKIYSQFALPQHPLLPQLEILAQILSSIFLHLHFQRRTQQPAMLSQTPQSNMNMCIA